MIEGHLKIGTRGSELALTQAREVQGTLRRAHPGLEVEIRVIQTTGDQRLDLKLSQPESTGKIPKGLFTKELETALAAGDIDIAVHSLKDLPTEMAPELVWAATLPRERVEDVLVTRERPPERARGLNFLPTGALVSTSSVRRARLLRHFRPDLALEDIRGNVPTRLRKLAAKPEMAATVLAFAGLHRLELLDEAAGLVKLPDIELFATVLDARVFMPAVGQGALGLQARKDDTRTLEALAAVNDLPTFQRATAERAFLNTLGGGCQAPVGVFSQLEPDSGRLSLRCSVFTDHPTAPPYQAGLFAWANEGEALGRQLAAEVKAALGSSLS